MKVLMIIPAYNEEENIKNTVEKIRSSYTEKPISKLDELRVLNKKVEKPAKIFAYIFGIIGALVLGIGMCLAMPEVIEGYMPLGIAVGVVGIIMVGLNYYIYKAMLMSRRNKHKDEVLTLSDEILNA